jgi:hypothetical protein
VVRYLVAISEADLQSDWGGVYRGSASMASASNCCFSSACKRCSKFNFSGLYVDPDPVVSISKIETLLGSDANLNISFYVT